MSHLPLIVPKNFLSTLSHPPLQLHKDQDLLPTSPLPIPTHFCPTNQETAFRFPFKCQFPSEVFQTAPFPPRPACIFSFTSSFYSSSPSSWLFRSLKIQEACVPRQEACLVWSLLFPQWLNIPRNTEGAQWTSSEQSKPREQALNYSENISWAPFYARPMPAFSGFLSGLQ